LACEGERQYSKGNLSAKIRFAIIFPKPMMRTTHLSKYLDASRLSGIVSQLGQRSSCSEAAVYLLELSAELQEEGALEDACRILTESLCQPSPIVTERFLELLFLYPHTLLPFAAHIISGSTGDVESALKIYKDLMKADRSVVVPVLASVCELPLSEDAHSDMLATAVSSMDSVPEADVPSLLRAILKLSGPRCGFALDRVHEYLQDASPELVFMALEVLDDVSRTDQTLLERILCTNALHVRETKEHSDCDQPNDLGSRVQVGFSRGMPRTFRIRTISPFDLSLWFLVLSRVRTHKIIESVISQCIHSGVLTTASLKPFLPKYAGVVERFSSGALRFIRMLYSHEKTDEVLTFCVPHCFKCFEDIRTDIVKDLLGISFKGSVPLQSSNSVGVQQRRQHLRLQTATILRDLCLFETESMLPFAQLIIDRVSAFPHILHEERILALLAESFRILGSAEPSILSTLSSLIRKQALWQWNSACNIARMYIRSTPLEYNPDERFMVLRRIMDSVPADAREISAAALLGLIADSVEHDIDPGMFKCFLEKMLPDEIIQRPHTFRTKSLTKYTLHFTGSALRCYSACLNGSWHDLRLAIPRGLINLYEISLLATCHPQKEMSLETSDEALTCIAEAISTANSDEILRTIEAAVHGRQVILTAISQESKPVSTDIFGFYAQALDEFERAIAVGMLLLLERVPDSKNQLARIEALFKSCSEELSINLRISRMIHADVLHAANQIFCLLNELEKGSGNGVRFKKQDSLLSSLEWLDYLGETTSLCMHVDNQSCRELAPALLRLWYLTLARIASTDQLLVDKILGYDLLEYFEILTKIAKSPVEAILATDAFELCSKLFLRDRNHRALIREDTKSISDRYVSLRGYALKQRFTAELDAKHVRIYLSSPCGGTSRHPYLSERYRLWKWLSALQADVALREARRLLSIMENWNSSEPHPEFACLTNASAPWLALSLLRLCSRADSKGIRGRLRDVYCGIDISLRVTNLLEKVSAEREVCHVVLFTEILTILSSLQTKLNSLNHARPGQDLSISFVRDAVTFVLWNALRLCDKLCDASKLSRSGKKLWGKNEAAKKRLMKLCPRVLLRSEALRGEILSWSGVYAYDLRTLPDASVEEKFDLNILRNADFQGSERNRGEDNDPFFADAREIDCVVGEELHLLENSDADSDTSGISSQPSISNSESSVPDFYIRDGFGYPALETDPTHAIVSIRFGDK
jgi:hypothetical protein